MREIAGMRQISLIKQSGVLPKSTNSLRRLLVLSKQLLHVYAASAPYWESKALKTLFPVRRARPRFRNSILPVLDDQDLSDMVPPT